MQSQGIPYETQTFTTERFKSVVNKATEHGFTEIDLTPHVGDIFDDDDAVERLEFLRKHPKVEKYSFATHLLSPDHEGLVHIVHGSLRGDDRLWVDISVYGWDSESYKAQTGVDRFKDFLENFRQLVWSGMVMSNPYPLSSVNLYMRAGHTFEDFPESEIKNYMRDAIKLGASVENDEVSNLNWGGKIDQGKEPEEHRKGLCVHLVIHNGVFPDGDMTMCCCWDTFKELQFANIDDLDIFNSRYWRFITSHLAGNYPDICKNCNDFYLASSDDLEPYKHLHPIKRLLNDSRDK
jgi:hypothetical protein